MSVKDAINQAITLLDRITVEADEDSALGMAFVSGRISEDGFYITKNDLERSLKELEHQLAQAHRQGWEQGKAAAKLLSFSCSCHKAIAKMEYKEKAND